MDTTEAVLPTIGGSANRSAAARTIDLRRTIRRPYRWHDVAEAMRAAAEHEESKFREFRHLFENLQMPAGSSGQI